MTPNYPLNSRTSPVRMMVWCASILFILEPTMRSIGKEVDESTVLSTALLPGFWLPDLGLLLPIGFAFNELRARASRSSTLKILFLIFAAIATGSGFLHRNNLTYFVADVRIFIACVTGYSLMLLLPAQRTVVSRCVFGLSAANVLLSLTNLAMDPSASIGTEKAITTSFGFTSSTIAVGLLGPSLVFAVFARRKLVLLAAGLTTGVAVTTSMFIMQTRTLTATLLVGAGCSFLSFVKFSRQGSMRAIMPVLGVMVVMGCVLLTVAVSPWGAQRLPEFFARFGEGGALFASDKNWLQRVDELERARASMGSIELVVGSGFGGVTSTPDAYGDYATSLHIGILTIPWKMGAPIFFAVLAGIIVVFRKYLKALLGSNRLTRLPVNLAILVIGPGLFANIFCSCFSGGWSRESLLAMGFLYGFWERCNWGEFGGELAGPGISPFDRRAAYSRRRTQLRNEHAHPQESTPAPLMGPQ